MAVIKPHEIWYLHVPHLRARKVQTSLFTYEISIEPSLFAHKQLLTSMKALDSKLGGYFKFVILNL